MLTEPFPFSPAGLHGSETMCIIQLIFTASLWDGFRLLHGGGFKLPFEAHFLLFAPPPTSLKLFPSKPGTGVLQFIKLSVLEVPEQVKPQVSSDRGQVTLPGVVRAAEGSQRPSGQDNQDGANVCLY